MPRHRAPGSGGFAIIPAARFPDEAGSRHSIAFARLSASADLGGCGRGLACRTVIGPAQQSLDLVSLRERKRIAGGAASRDRHVEAVARTLLFTGTPIGSAAGNSKPRHGKILVMPVMASTFTLMLQLGNHVPSHHRESGQFQLVEQILAGAAGFEPANAGTKIWHLAIGNASTHRKPLKFTGNFP